MLADKFIAVIGEVYVKASWAVCWVKNRFAYVKGIILIGNCVQENVEEISAVLCYITVK